MSASLNWKHLYRACQDQAVAHQVAAILAQRHPDLLACAQLWKYLLEDLHPDLHINLHPERRDIGV